MADDNAKWVVVSRGNCPWCDKVKSMLSGEGITYTTYDIDVLPSIKMFIKDCGLNTVPQVFRNGKLIGGFGDTALWINDNIHHPEQLQLF